MNVIHLKGIVAQRIARPRQVRLPAQDRADLSHIPGDDRLLQHTEIGRVVKPFPHRLLEQ
jgi:hypothetical protein